MSFFYFLHPLVSNSKLNITWPSALFLSLSLSASFFFKLTKRFSMQLSEDKKSENALPLCKGRVSYGPFVQLYPMPHRRITSTPPPRGSRPSSRPSALPARGLRVSLEVPSVSMPEIIVNDGMLWPGALDGNTTCSTPTRARGSNERQSCGSPSVDKITQLRAIGSCADVIRIQLEGDSWDEGEEEESGNRSPDYEWDNAYRCGGIESGLHGRQSTFSIARGAPPRSSSLCVHATPCPRRSTESLLPDYPIMYGDQHTSSEIHGSFFRERRCTEYVRSRSPSGSFRDSVDVARLDSFCDREEQAARGREGKMRDNSPTLTGDAMGYSKGSDRGDDVADRNSSVHYKRIQSVRRGPEESECIKGESSENEGLWYPNGMNLDHLQIVRQQAAKVIPGDSLANLTKTESLSPATANSRRLSSSEEVEATWSEQQEPVQQPLHSEIILVGVVACAPSPPGQPRNN